MLRIEQAQQIHVQEAGRAAAILKRLFDKLERLARGEHLFNGFRWSNLNLIIGGNADVSAAWQSSDLASHLREGVVDVQKPPSLWVDKGDTDRHVSQDLLVEGDFLFDSPGRFRLPPIEPAC